MGAIETARDARSVKRNRTSGGFHLLQHPLKNGAQSEGRELLLSLQFFTNVLN